MIRWLEHFFRMKIYEDVNCVHLTANNEGRLYITNLKISVIIEHIRANTSLKYYEYILMGAATAGNGS